jgi:hypothetical protein
MLALVLVAAAHSGETRRELPLPPWGYAAIALAVFTVLFAITWSFRNVSNKH